MLKPLLQEEVGAQIVEYALIIAVISLGLLIALQALPISADQGIESLVTRIVDCLVGDDCT